MVSNNEIRNRVNKIFTLDKAQYYERYVYLLPFDLNILKSSMIMIKNRVLNLIVNSIEDKSKIENMFIDDVNKDIEAIVIITSEGYMLRLKLYKDLNKFFNDVKDILIKEERYEDVINIVNFSLIFNSIYENYLDYDENNNLMYE